MIVCKYYAEMGKEAEFWKSRKIDDKRDAWLKYETVVLDVGEKDGVINLHEEILFFRKKGITHKLEVLFPYLHIKIKLFCFEAQTNRFDRVLRETWDYIRLTWLLLLVNKNMGV